MVGNWLHFTGRQGKRKRAELVCVLCHTKKTKCDLQSRNRQGHQKCSNCDAPDRECHVRPSKRAKQRPNSNTNLEFRNIGPDASVSPAQGETLQVSDEPLADVIDPSLTQPFTTSPSAGALAADIRKHQNSSTSPGEGAGRSVSGDVDTGFLRIYGPENQLDAEQQEYETALDSRRRPRHPQQQELLQSFAETYWDYCYTWCPVLDRDTLAEDLERSPLLANALALAASHIRPPLVPHDGPATYYERARGIFYNDEETDGLTILRALALFYWWAPRPPSIAHRHSSWWWTSVIVRHAQQMSIHREPSANHPLFRRLNMSLRRRIWWTAFARERLTALCQSKPCIIDPDDCSLQEAQLSDFPPDAASQRKGLVFIHWVRLCGIMGRIAKRLSLSGPEAQPFPGDLQQQLADWARELPPELQLPIDSARTEAFDRDVHQLHLPYLTTIIILHLKRSAHDIPQALPPAVLAASCIARILRDVLSRGDVRFLMPITCWYSGTAFVPLLQACRVERFAQEAGEGLDVLDRAVRQLQAMWGSARVISQGFERLRRTFDGGVAGDDAPLQSSAGGDVPAQAASGAGTLTMPVDLLDWVPLFPFVTPSTGKIAEGLLADREQGMEARGFPFPDDALFNEPLLSEYHNLLDPSRILEFSDLLFET